MAMSDHSKAHLMVLIYKSILGKHQTHVCTQKSDCRCSLRSQDVVLLSVPSAWTELGKEIVQNDLKLRDSVSLPLF